MIAGAQLLCQVFVCSYCVQQTQHPGLHNILMELAVVHVRVPCMYVCSGCDPYLHLYCLHPMSVDWSHGKSLGLLATLLVYGTGKEAGGKLQ